MRERLVFNGKVQGCGANMKFLSKQLLSIKMTYICREHGVGGIEATHTVEIKAPASCCSIFLLHCCCLFNWNINGCIFHGQDRVVFTVKRSGHLARGLICLSCFNTYFLPNFFSPLVVWSCSVSSAPALFIDFPVFHLAKSLSSFLTVFQWWNVFLLLPSLSHRCLCLSAWGLWDCGRAALPWQRAMLPNCVHLGFGVSLRSLPLSYLFHLSLRFSLV